LILFFKKPRKSETARLEIAVYSENHMKNISTMQSVGTLITWYLVTSGEVSVTTGRKRSRPSVHINWKACSANIQWHRVEASTLNNGGHFEHAAVILKL
jgi:hypothetical protein